MPRSPKGFHKKETIFLLCCIGHRVNVYTIENSAFCVEPTNHCGYATNPRTSIIAKDLFL